jgi:DNA-binding Xre family transcriptional regulator
LSEIKRMYVLASDVPSVVWGEARAKLFRDLAEGRSSYQIAESLNSAGIKCSVANIKKIMSGKSATVPLDFALSMCKALSINPYALLPLLEIVESRSFKDPIDLATYSS